MIFGKDSCGDVGGSSAKQNLVPQMSWAESYILSCLCWDRQKITRRPNTW